VFIISRELCSAQGVELDSVSVITPSTASLVVAAGRLTVSMALEASVKDVAVVIAEPLEL